MAFEVAAADSFPGGDYDLACLFDCWHDMGDPLAAATHIRQALADDGTLLLVDPMAGDDLTDNLHPVGRMLYATSTVLCVPSSLAQDGATGLGAQAGEARLTEVLTDAGFTHVRRAAETPFTSSSRRRPDPVAPRRASGLRPARGAHVTPKVEAMLIGSLSSRRWKRRRRGIVEQ